MLPTDMGGLGVLCSKERHRAIYEAKALASFPALQNAMPEYDDATLTNGAAPPCTKKALELYGDEMGDASKVGFVNVDV